MHEQIESSLLHRGSQTGQTDSTIDLYAGNPLIEVCGPILSPREIVSQLICLPPVHHGPFELPPHVLVHELGNLRRLHVPSEPGIQVAQTLDFLIRQGYVHRHPADVATRRLLSGLPVLGGTHAAVQLAAAVVGLSGVGKSEALERALMLKPQVANHDKFPGLVGPVRQLVWLKVDVPESGRLKDLAEALFRATDLALGTHYLEFVLSGRQRVGSHAAAEWVAKMRCHFLGVLVIDEVQNLFRLSSKELRQEAARRGLARPQLRVVEDMALKFILNLTNTSKIPVVFAGTPDGLAAMESRMSTASRLSTGGLITFGHAQTPDDPFYSKVFLPRLVDYQWLPQKIAATPTLRQQLHRLSGGLLRNTVGLWHHAQHRAVLRSGRHIEPEDLEFAAQGPMKMTFQAIEALQSQDPRRMGAYEDLLPGHFRG